MEDRPYAYVCSPYKGDTEGNTERAREYSRQVFEAGYTPWTPHIYFSQFLNEDNPAERREGIEMGAQFLAQCRVLVVCGDEISAGMRREIRLAEQLHVPILTLNAFLPEAVANRPSAPSPTFMEQITAARSGRAVVPESTRNPRQKNGDIGKIYVFVANPNNYGPDGHVDTMLKLPVTKEEFAEALRSIGIGSKYNPQKDYSFHSVQSWDDRLRPHLPRSIDDNGFNELNYLAAKLNALTEPQREVFLAVMESGRHCGSVKDIINVTENLDFFDHHPFYSAEQYGGFLAEMGRDEFEGTSERLAKSKDPDMRELAAYIGRLESHFDAEAYGQALVSEEGGVFTEYGYLPGGEDFQEIYTGVHDIPAEYRVASFPEKERTAPEKPSVLNIIAASRSEHAATQEKPSPDKPKSHDPEL